MLSYIENFPPSPPPPDPHPLPAMDTAGPPPAKHPRLHPGQYGSDHLLLPGRAWRSAKPDHFPARARLHATEVTTASKIIGGNVIMRNQPTSHAATCHQPTGSRHSLSQGEVGQAGEKSGLLRKQRRPCPRSCLLIFPYTMCGQEWTVVVGMVVMLPRTTI